MKFRIIPFLRSNGVVKYAHIGFGIGGYITFLACRDRNVACGVGISSSIEIFRMHGSSEISAAGEVLCPQLLIQADDDLDVTMINGEVHLELKKHSFGEMCSVYHFNGVKHGWLLRGDYSDEIIMRNATKAVELILSFIRTNVMENITCCCPVPLSG